MNNTALFDLNVSITDSPEIRDLANINPELLPLFTPTERAVILVCKDIVGVEA